MSRHPSFLDIGPRAGVGKIGPQRKETTLNGAGNALPAIRHAFVSLRNRFVYKAADRALGGALR
jgi:hypothetical protein